MSARAVSKNVATASPAPTHATAARTPARKRPRGRPPGGGVRADSLWGALGDETRRKTVCDWLFGEGMPNTKCAERIEEVFRIHTSAKAVKFFYQQHTFAWKIGQAKSQAEIEKGLLPQNWEARIREALAQRRFETVFNALTDKQIIAFEKLDLEKRKVDLKASEVFLTERRLILLEKKMQDAQLTLEDSSITADEQAHRIRKILGQE